jgi:hypothetical protein
MLDLYFWELQGFTEIELSNLYLNHEKTWDLASRYIFNNSMIIKECTLVSFIPRPLNLSDTLSLQYYLIDLKSFISDNRSQLDNKPVAWGSTRGSRAMTLGA